MRDGLLVATVAVALLGCDSDCENVCEAGQECLLFEDFVGLECDDVCDIQEDLADAQGCSREFDAYYGCVADGQRDECLFIYPCDAERNAFNVCRGAQ